MFKTLNIRALNEKINAAFLFIAGAAVGFVNGFFGGGGGMLAVPILFALRKNIKKAHATAMAVILPLSAVSGVIYFIKGAADIPVLLIAGGGVIAGGVLGAFLLKKIKNEGLALLFYVLMVLSGIYSLVWGS
ncbi:MAG: TSUP family transporter [Clostridiales bacterium]|jgi:uncharacterized membrane protein YfcA|nr:TSUP family transporter [Clostridiales bacterium]